jgi:cell division transport system ATP-binding protein
MIRFEGVTKDFGNDYSALDDISFEINKGDFVFITGHSGCGKTTLLRLLLRELHPTSGTIYFEDCDLGTLSSRKVAKHRRQVGVVFQDYQLLDDLTVFENIALPLIIAKHKQAEINERISELLKLLGLTDMEEAFPAQLSGGEAQRVGLARALATAPKIIFADEPTGNLDHRNAVAIINLLQSVNRYGTTVILATHNLDLLPLVPHAKCLQLKQGKIVTKPTSKKTPSKTPQPDKPKSKESKEKHE